MTHPAGVIDHIGYAGFTGVIAAAAYFTLFRIYSGWRYLNLFDKSVRVSMLAACALDVPALGWLIWAEAQPHIEAMPPWPPAWIVLAAIASFLLGVIFIVPTGRRYGQPDCSFLMAAAYSGSLSMVDNLVDIDGGSYAFDIYALVSTLVMILALLGFVMVRFVVQPTSRQRLSRPRPTPPLPQGLRDEFGLPMGIPDPDSFGSPSETDA